MDCPSLPVGVELVGQHVQFTVDDVDLRRICGFQSVASGLIHWKFTKKTAKRFQFSCQIPIVWPTIGLDRRKKVAMNVRK